MRTESPPNIPPHVPPERVVDFDYLRPEGVEEDLHLAWHRVQQTSPDIFWTPRNGGHWVATRAEDIQAIQLDPEHFSHARITIRPHETAPSLPAIPLELDPPRHASFRALISPAFSARAVAALEARVRQTTVSLIESFVKRGECEFVGEFAQVLPVAVFLGIVDLPQEDRTTLLPWAEAMIRPKSPEAAMQAHGALAQYLARWLAQRQARPGEDLLSHIVQSKIDGRPITMEEALSLSLVVLSGGLDTVASMLGFVARFLALNPGHRRQLIDHPELIPNAVDELIRRHGLVNTARLITRDFEFKGVSLKKGEQILVPNHLFGLDERKVPEPLKVDFNRPQAAQSYAAFGNGPHRCPGSMLAKNELKVFLQEWLVRIPDFRIKPGTKPVQVSGVVNTTHALHLSWEPMTS